MSFGLPSVKGPFDGQKELGLVSGPFEVHDTFGFGIKKVKDNVTTVHPLELSERNYSLREEKLNLGMLRNNQGLHAPLKVMAEIRATRQVGRLPFLSSSELSSSTIKNSDDFIDFTDFLNHSDFEEKRLIPHVVMERSLGIL
ncbi:proteasome maturation protein [Halyomorpha halys]|uniref:proteasome maturation protein n=1 Tax=Halyomorpha halys TaxID=286706 RepID=UPI0006D51B6B|nr:proteasome maturation protein [Halyomorpha halys]